MSKLKVNRTDRMSANTFIKGSRLRLRACTVDALKLPQPLRDEAEDHSEIRSDAAMCRARRASAYDTFRTFASFRLSQRHSLRADKGISRISPDEPRARFFSLFINEITFARALGLDG